MLFKRFEQGKPCEPLETRPILYADLRSLWDSFWLLSNTRGYTDVGPLPIAMADIKSYLDLFPVPDPHRFVRNIYLLDSAYLQYSRDKIEAERTRQEKLQKSRAVNRDGRNNKRRH